MLSLQRCTRLTRTCISPPLKTTCPHSALTLYPAPLYLVLQLYLEDLEAKVIPVERSPPSLSSSLLSWAGTAVNRGPLLLLLNKRLSEKDKRLSEKTMSSRLPCDLVVALQSCMCPMPPVTSLLSQWHAFRKLFLKLSERKAYSTGLMAELEYWRQSERRITITRVLLWLKPGSWLKLNPD